MRLTKARIKKYRSIQETEFEIENDKTILVGPNEAGKTAILQALQHLNPPKGIRPLDPLRDYPRREYDEIKKGRVDPAKVTIIEGHYVLEDADKKVVHPDFHGCTYVVWRNLDGKAYHRIDGCPGPLKFAAFKKDLVRLATYVDGRVPEPPQTQPAQPKPGAKLDAIIGNWPDDYALTDADAQALTAWLKVAFPLIEEGRTEERRHDRIKEQLAQRNRRDEVLKLLSSRQPVYVLFSNYFRVRPLVHLGHLADRVDNNTLNDEQYDYGNKCLLQLLGFTARELSNLGRVADPAAGNKDAYETYRAQLDKRHYQLNSASVKLTDEIRAIWAPNPERNEASKLRVLSDGQYLKVVVEDELGVEIELDQRSEGFQWLVSFFVVFFAEAEDKYRNAILLLDEPGLSLHGLKQREFRGTVSRLAEKNQTIYTTHSPFLVGPDELDIVRVVEMKDRRVGTKAHTTVTASDPAALLPLQEALGYDLAQSLFAQERNIVLEGLTDYWYIEAVAQLLRDAGQADLNEKIALVPANTAGKVVYYATILHAQKLKVAALLDSDAAGDQAAKQEALVHTLGNKRILRTRDYYAGPVSSPEVEDMLRETLVYVAKSELSWDVAAKAKLQPSRSVVDLFEGEVEGFSKYRLSKAFLRWSRTVDAGALTNSEREAWVRLIDGINKALK